MILIEDARNLWPVRGGGDRIPLLAIDIEHISDVVGLITVDRSVAVDAM